MTADIVAFDIETTNLKANFGRVLACCFAPLGSEEVIVMRGDEKKYKRKKLYDDSALVLDIKEYLESKWCWLSWNGKLFDIPFLNARLVLAGEEPIEKRMHCDLMYYSRGNSMKLNNSRLDTVAKAFELKEQKTELIPREWVEAMMLDHDALDEVSKHCVQDVKVLRELFPILSPFIANIHK